VYRTGVTSEVKKTKAQVGVFKKKTCLHLNLVWDNRLGGLGAILTMQEYVIKY